MTFLKGKWKLIAFNPHQGHLALGIGNAQSDMEVDVNGIQYAWIFSYPESGITSGELHVPVNTQVKLNMKAGDVIHAFWVPQLRLKQDVLPGRDSALAFNANKVGKYPIICAELCGPYHGGMKTFLYVHTPEEYQKWVEENTTVADSQAQTSTMVSLSPQQAVESPLKMDSHHLGVTPEMLAQLQPSE